MCACISLRADKARLAVRVERWREEVHLVCTPAQRVPHEHPLSPPREAIDMLDIYSGHFFIYRSLFAADPRDLRVKSSGYKRRLRRVLRRRELFLGRGSARRVGGARMRRFCRRCLHGSPCTGVGTREYPSSTRRGTLVVCRTPHAVVWTGMPTWQRTAAAARRCNRTAAARVRPVEVRRTAYAVVWTWQRGRVAALQQVREQGSMRKRKAHYLLCLTLGGWAAASACSGTDAFEFVLLNGTLAV